MTDVIRHGRQEPLLPGRNEARLVTLADRFWSRVSKDPDGCWEWTGYRSSNGYGRFGNEAAHRTSWRLSGRTLARALTLDHLCRNRGCVNPAHLEQVTNRENVMRGIGWPVINAAKTECVNGHPYTPENTYWHREPYGSYTRNCRTCRTIERRRRREKQGGRVDGKPRCTSRLREGHRGWRCIRPADHVFDHPSQHAHLSISGGRRW